MTTLKKKNNNENLLKAISFLRLSLTYDELGEQLGYKKATISKYLNGRLPPSDEFLKTFEDVFKVDLDSFNTETPLPNSERGVVKDNFDLVKENEFLKETIKDLLKILVNKQ